MKGVKEVKPITPPYPFDAYAHIVRPLTDDEGGGFLITFPDLPGCMSDGETIEDAIANGRDAFLGWVAIQADLKREVPKPQWRPEEDKTMPLSVSGKFIQRLPKTVHAKLVKRAKHEGVSLNSLVLAFIAEGLGRREGKDKAA
jgi:antitoxin HicB